MKTYTYTVYHIPGIKIGCTTDLEKRISDQGFSNYEILWQEKGNYEHGWIAGDIEKQLQKEYGLPIDKNHYQIAREARMAGTLKSVQTNLARGHMELISTFESRSRGGKIAGKIAGKFNLTTKGRSNGGKLGGLKPVTENSNVNQKWKCPDGHITNGINYKRWCIKRGLDPNNAIQIS